MRIVRGVPAMAPLLVPRLRGADLEDLKLCGEAPEEALRDAILYSLPDRRFAFVDDAGTVHALLGVGAVDCTNGWPWMVTSREMVTRHWRWLLRSTAPMLEVIEEGFTSLQNFVHKDNLVHIRWLEWAGYTVHKDRLFFNEYYLLHKERHAPSSSGWPNRT